MQGDGEVIEGNILMTAGVRWGERARKIKTERQRTQAVLAEQAP